MMCAGDAGAHHVLTTAHFWRLVSLLTIGFKELLLIGALIGGLIWMRMFRARMDQATEQFFHRLKAPDAGGTGFGWRGLAVAFVLGLACCGGVLLVLCRVWSWYQRG
jgi:hypothetical protein